MIRISTIFIAICMVLVAASLGLVLHAVAGFSGTESAIVALTALTFLILYNAVSMRLRDRSDVGGQIADLSRGTADLARQVAEFGRRLAAVEGRVVSANSASSDRIQAVLGEINELGGLVKHLAISVASHEDLIASGAVAAPPAPSGRPHSEPPEQLAIAAEQAAPAVRPAPVAAAKPAPSAEAASPSRSQPQLLAAVKNAVEESRLDIYLQPMVTLPQRKVRYYEAVTRLRDDKDQILAADDFIATAEAGGLIGKIDHMVMLRCIQVLRRLMVRNKDVGVFCNVSAATLGNPANFAQCLDFLEANRALAPSFVLDLADRGVRFIKVPAALLLDPKQSSTSDIHPSDLSDLLGRFGIDLIAEKIEGERAVVDLLDYDVRFGQGFLFAPPRPLRPEGASATGGAAANKESGTPNGSSSTVPIPGPAAEPAMRATGNAALARRAAGPG
jgi:cyclic-di-GMP phosphodiesterase TipF (flagellum assembly factor)